MSPAETRRDVAHLLRRAGFGGHAEEIDALAADGYAAAVATICDLAAPDAAADALTTPTFDTAGYLAAQRGDAEARRAARQRARQERISVLTWWLRRMAVSERPLREKLTFLWHDHFATSVQKVKLAELMHVQRQTLYELGGGRFDELAAAMVRDPAMLIWLDGRESTAAAPNENFAREFLELFTLGHSGSAGAGHGDDHGGDHAGAQPYSEQDVTEAARAFTGWRFERGTPETVLDPNRHDDGTKTILGTTGPLGADDVVSIATTHPSCAPHVVSRLWSRVARPAAPDDPVVAELAESFAADLDTGALLRRIFSHPEFLAEKTRAALVKTPVEYLVGMARALRVSLGPVHIRSLVALGQVPFMPPDVSGWPANEGWLSTSSALARLQLAAQIAAAADVGSLTAAPVKSRPKEAARILGVAGWGDVTHAALTDAAADPNALLTLALVAPEYILA